MAAFSTRPPTADPRVAPAKSGYADPGKQPLVPRLDAPVVQRQAADRVVAREGKDDAEILAHQARLNNTDIEIPALEGALLATRKEAVKRGLLSQASFDAGLALSQAMTQLQPAVAAKGTVDPWQQQLAAFAAQRLFASLQRETADDKHFDPIASPARESTGERSQNRYTGELRFTTYLLWKPVQHTVVRLVDLPDLIRQGRWDDAFRGYRQMFDGFDLWVADQLRKTGKGTPEEALGNAQQHHAQLRTGLEQIADKHARRLPALFHPDAKIVEQEKAAGRPAADAIPMNVYFWKDDHDGTFHLYDLTTPGRPHEQTIDGPPTAAMMTRFFEEVARYPEGEVRYALPGGASGIAPTTGKTKWYEWVGYAGLAIAGVGLALLTGGASIPATVCFAAGAIAGGVSAGGHLVDTARLGTATSVTVVLDVAQIVASFASFGAMSITVKAGGAAAALGGSRWFVPLVSTAAGADVVQLVALGDLTFVELDKIQHGPGSPEDKQRAMTVLCTQLVVMGGLTALSVHGARGARALAGHPLEVAEQNGARVLRVVGDDAQAAVRGKGSEDGAAVAGNQPKVMSEPSGDVGARVPKIAVDVEGTKTAGVPKTERVTPKPTHEGTVSASGRARGPMTEAQRRHSLGEDPATGQFRQNEMDTALRLEAATGAHLERFQPAPGQKGDWRDMNTGLVYDGCSPGAGPFFNKSWNKYNRSLDDHLNHSAVHRVVVDATDLNLTSTQFLQLENHLASLPANQQAKIIRIGFER